MLHSVLNYSFVDYLNLTNVLDTDYSWKYVMQLHCELYKIKETVTYHLKIIMWFIGQRCRSHFWWVRLWYTSVLCYFHCVKVSTDVKVHSCHVSVIHHIYWQNIYWRKRQWWVRIWLNWSNLGSVAGIICLTNARVRKKSLEVFCLND